MLPTKSTTCATMSILLGLLACTSLLTSGCGERPTVFVTGQDYIRLQAGQTYTAPRQMTLATESVIQEKDEQIFSLLQANSELTAELQFLRSKGDR